MAESPLINARLRELRKSAGQVEQYITEAAALRGGLRDACPLAGNPEQFDLDTQASAPRQNWLLWFAGR